MAKKARRSSSRKSSVIESSLRDAQKVLSGYIESGGKQVRDTMSSLVKIFENQHLTEALSSGSRRLSRAVRGGATRGKAAKPASPTSRRGKPAGAQRRVAAARATTAKRSGRALRPKSRKSRRARNSSKG